ncbi:HNH endonuclease [Hirschia litorea]|uniref:HNH endonuclease n=1 Tax=Hirschia litorea TaxID=1199156 RepID=A0ABW2INX8_9PROT
MNEFAKTPLLFLWDDQSVEMDMPTNTSDKLRRFFRPKSRGFYKSFFNSFGAQPGDVVVLEQLGSHKFRLHLEKPDGTYVSARGPAKDIYERIDNWARCKTRPAQYKFRQAIARRDGLKCVISGCEIEATLEAAHLHQRGEGGNDTPVNGVIMRADIHKLFDAHLLTISQQGKVSINPGIDDLTYSAFEDIQIKTGADLKYLSLRYANR